MIGIRRREAGGPVSSDERAPRTFDQRLTADLRPERSTLDSAECFADEIAIDFPSVAALLDRMRAAFFGRDDSHDPLSAEILLSAREALEGVTVPLDVPVRGTCRVCGGRGGTWTEACHACRGSGAAFFNHQVRVAVPARVCNGARFRFTVSSASAPPTRVELRVAIR